MFLTHVIIGSCSILTKKHVVKISKNLPLKLQDISIQIHGNHFLGPVKNRALHFISSLFYEKYPKWWCFFGLFFLDKLATYLENFTSFGIVQHIGKK